MHRRLIISGLLLSCFVLLLFTACNDSGITAPGDGDQSDSQFWPVDSRAGGSKGGGKGGGGNNGGKINCKKDKALDQPAQILNIEIESAMRIHIVAGGGSDATNNVVIPNWYEIEDQSGHIEYVPSGIYIGDKNELLDLHVQGLRPGENYVVRLQSQDLCGNTGLSADQVIALPNISSDAAAPSITSFQVKNKASFVASFRVIEVQAADNTGLAKIEYYFNGQLLHTLDLQNALKCWIAGQIPTYDWVVPSELKGQYGQVTVRVFDPSNNMTEASKYATL